MSTQPVQPATEERDGRIYFAPSSSVPMVPYLLAVDDYAREVRMLLCNLDNAIS
jgi:hypothetical protein